MLIFYFYFIFPVYLNTVHGEEESKILRESRFSSQGTQECGKDPAEDLLRMSWARAEPTQQGGQHGLCACGAEVTPTDAETELRSDLNMLHRLKEWSLECCHSVVGRQATESRSVREAHPTLALPELWKKNIIEFE